MGAGLSLAVVGAALLFLPKISWLGHLPGDIYVKRDTVSLYFPITTCLLISLLLSVLFGLFKK
jgi:hypothetical protein